MKSSENLIRLNSLNTKSEIWSQSLNKRLSENEKKQARNQEFFRTSDISWNEGISVKYLQHTKERLQENVLEFFS